MKNIRMSIATILAISIMAACSDNDDNSQPVAPDGPSTGDVRALTTTSNRAKDLTESWIDFSTTDNMAPSTIRVSSDVRFQSIDGFGAAITGSTAYNLSKMTPEDRVHFLMETFSPTEGYGMSYVRVPIGCSDFSLSEYTCCDEQGIENFALTDEENKYVIPVLKEILAINPAVKIISAPWTAPRWMKISDMLHPMRNDGWGGGRLNPDCYQDYATYFVKWIQAFKGSGIDIYAVSPQNEPLNLGNSASMFMGWEEERDFVKNALGPKFREAGIATKIYVYDHNYDYSEMTAQKSYPTKIYEDADASKYIVGAAFHNYGGNMDELLNVHNANPDKELLFTESTAGDWNDGANLTARLADDMEQITLGPVNRWCRGSIVWNLMLDAQRGPNRPNGGATTAFGVVDIDADYKNITRNSYYYIMAHMSDAAKPGAVRIGTSGFAATGLTYAAFLNSDNTYGMAFSNKSSEDTRFTVDDGTHHFTVTVPANGIMSITWK